mgnify:CR=1 FL=1
METSLHVFQKTQSALARAIQVGQIATYDLQTCAPDEPVKDVLEKYPEFDQIPIKENGTVIGVIERKGRTAGQETAAKCMRRLEDCILVSEELPLSEFLPLMADPPYYRLVLAGNRINAVVTRSDLLKLPVRLLAFTKISQLETAMQELIELCCPDGDAWLPALPERSQQRVKCYQERAKKSHSDLTMLEFTTLRDKGTIIQEMCYEGKTVLGNLDEVYLLRNVISHGGNYAGTARALAKFIRQLERTDRCIEELDVLAHERAEKNNSV